MNPSWMVMRKASRPAERLAERALQPLLACRRTDRGGYKQIGLSEHVAFRPDCRVSSHLAMSNAPS